MTTPQLNLTRLWRSRTFQEIIGQSLIVRMLKNSLYRDLFFPVYLFAGPKGCGKTTTARVFAASIHCQGLTAFQKGAAQDLPCLSCSSCHSFINNNHPDFIEIDGASHTSVDHIRSLIDNASFLPVMGKKKVYLIDEAHMLSKAACNAFLKILEEPPPSALFILATTDAHKIIDTVISRCFQLYFKPIEPALIAHHLEAICKQESIHYEPAALEMIAAQSDGSVRDGINLLERVRFAYDAVLQLHVSELLGCIDSGVLVRFLEKIIANDQEGLALCLAQSNLERFSLPLVWKKWLDLLTDCVWVKINAIEKVKSYPVDQLSNYLTTVSIQQLNQYRRICYRYELHFIKTSAPQELFEMLLLELCASEKYSLSPSVEKNQKLPDRIEKKVVNVWDSFNQSLSSVCDPLVQSLFKQAVYQSHDPVKQEISLVLPKNMSLFQSRLHETESIWLPLLHQAYGAPVKLFFTYTEVGPKPVKNISPTTLPAKEPLSERARTLISLFPGTVTIVKGQEL